MSAVNGGVGLRPVGGYFDVFGPALRVLCYHSVQPGTADRYTVTTDELEWQLAYLAEAGFEFIHVRDLLSDAELPGRPVILTFDDCYSDTVEHGLPILRRFQAKATFFVATGYAGDRACWDRNGALLLGPDELQGLDPDLIELALHSHSHRAFEDLSLSEIADDIGKSFEFFDTHDIPYTHALACPYDSRPKFGLRGYASRLFDDVGIPLAFGGGNRVNRLPLRDRHAVHRIDIAGGLSRAAFRRKLWIGGLL